MVAIESGILVFAVSVEHTSLVPDCALVELSVQSDAGFAAGREMVDDVGAVDEIQISRACQLFEAERHLEFASANLEVVEVTDVHEDVAPGVLVAQLALDLVLEVLQEASLDTHALPVHFEPVLPRHGRVVRADVTLQL